MRRGTYIYEAGFTDVLKKIERRVRDNVLVERLVEKVKKYLKTKNKRDDLTLQESGYIYGPYDYGDTLPLSNKRNLDIDWSNHAEYHGDLRDISPDKINKAIREWLKERLRKKGPDHKKVKMKLPGSGTAVVDYDLTQKPAEADVITVWGADMNHIERVRKAMFTKRMRRIVASLIETIPKEQDTLWYENEDGDKFVPDLSGNMPPEIPEDFKYQHSRFPTQLRENMLKIVQEDEVDACEHPIDHIDKDFGIIDSMEGRTCNKCGGYQSKQKGELWPDKWEAHGSIDLGGGESGWSEDLALALVKNGFTLSNAIIVTATSCERCMNTLAYDCGLDWGYAEGSEDWQKCGTECGFCKGDLS